MGRLGSVRLLSMLRRTVMAFMGLWTVSAKGVCSRESIVTRLALDTEHFCFPETDGQRQLAYDPCLDRKNQRGLWPASDSLLCMLSLSFEDLKG